MNAVLLAPGIDERQRADAIRGRVHAAIAAGAFRPVFQPIIDLASGAIVGYEALSRGCGARRERAR